MALVLGLAASMGGGVAEGAVPAEYRRDRLILEREPGVGEARMEEIHRAAGGRRLKSYPGLDGLEVAALPEGADFAQVEAAYRAQKGVKAVHRDYLRRVSATPNDPNYANGRLWGLHNTGQNGGRVDADIDGPEAWDVRTDASSVVVAVIDTGVRVTHEDLAANMWVNPGEVAGNNVDDDGNGYVDDVHGINAINGSGNPNDDNGHGTHCAGTIAAVGNNGRGIVGVAWRARIMALKFLSAEGSGSDSDAIECINYARLKGAHIMSNSWGGGGENPAMVVAIEAARNAGIVFVAAAGNEANNNDATPSYPASYDVSNIVSVAATDRRDDLADFSNYGANSVDLAAPGVAIFSTYYRNNTDYTSLDGTSMATPHVAGAFALLRAQYPAESASLLITRLLAAVDPVAALARRCRTGGRLNIFRALNAEVPRPTNDDFASRFVLTGTSATGSALTLSATAQAGEPNHAGVAPRRSVWWSWTAPAAGRTILSTAGSDHDTVLAAYTGTSVNLLVPVISNDNAAPGRTTSEVEFNATAGTTYAIAVDGNGGSVTLLVAQVPANDDFSGRAIVSGDNFRLTANNGAATREGSEPAHGGAFGQNSLWWQWTCPTTARYMLSTSGSTFDTTLGIYTGVTLQTLNLVAQDDDGGPGLSAEIFFDGFAGQTYVFAVDGYEGDYGSILLTLANRLNDDYSQRRLLTGAAAETFAHNVGATVEGPEPLHDGNIGGASLWWEWVAPASGPVTVHTYGSDFDTLVAVYTGTSLGALTERASNDDFGGSLTSLVTFPAIQGASYKIAVDGYSDGIDTSIGIVSLTLAAETGEAPQIVQQPAGANVASGANVTLSVVANGTSPMAYQWYRNDQQVVGNATATSPDLVIAGATTAVAGAYRCVVTNAYGSATTAAADLVVGTSGGGGTGRLTNLSARAVSGTGANVLIAGFVLNGGTKTLLVRGLGPKLGTQGVTGFLLDPQIGLYRGATELSLNNNWASAPNAATVAATATAVGATSLTAGSLDSALLPSLTSGPYTVIVSGADGGTGVALAELYDTDITGGARLVNIAARAAVGTGGDILIAGFVVSGGNRTVLLRGVGPTLAGQGVTGVLANPQITLFRGSTVVSSNDNWGQGAEPAAVVNAAATVGAFALPEGSTDAALLTQLQPGVYTVHVGGVGNTTGVALVEVYEVP